MQGIRGCDLHQATCLLTSYFRVSAGTRTMLQGNCMKCYLRTRCRNVDRVTYDQTVKTAINRSPAQ